MVRVEHTALNKQFKKCMILCSCYIMGIPCIVSWMIPFSLVLSPNLDFPALAPVARFVITPDPNENYYCLSSSQLMLTTDMSPISLRYLRLLCVQSRKMFRI